MDSLALTDPVITDKQALEEFVEALTDLTPGIERDVANLRQKPGDHEVIASLFRAIHNIKGDATLCKVDLAVSIAHPIETVLARVRNDEATFSDVLSEAILLAIDRLELAAEALLMGKSLVNLNLVTLVECLDTMAAAESSLLDASAADMIEAVLKARVMDPIMIIMADLPLVTSDLIDEIIDVYESRPEPALSTHTPLELHSRLDRRPDSLFNYRGRLIVPAGINVLNGAEIEKEQEDFHLIMERIELAVNVNVPSDLKLCERIMQGDFL